jgi:hypothetical protein
LVRGEDYNDEDAMDDAEDNEDEDADDEQQKPPAQNMMMVHQQQLLTMIWMTSKAPAARVEPRVGGASPME